MVIVLTVTLLMVTHARHAIKAVRHALVLAPKTALATAQMDTLATAEHAVVNQCNIPKLYYSIHYDLMGDQTSNVKLL